MASDKPSAPDTAPRREPPTIDLSQAEFSSQTAPGDTPSAAPPNSERLASHVPGEDTVRPFLAAVLCSLLAALSAALLLWGSGLFGESAATRAKLNEVAQRTSELSSQVNRTDAAVKSNATAGAAVAELAARADAMEKTIGALRSELADAKRQNETLAASLAELSATARAGGTSDPQLLERLARLEGAVQGSGSAPAEPAPNSGLQRLMVATTLDTAVRRNEPFAPALSAAKQASDNASTLSPLDAFAEKGLPADAASLREIRAILTQIKNTPAPPRASDAPAQPSANADGWLGRLQAGLGRLIRVERVDPPAAQAPATPALDAALRSDDLAGVRRELAASPYASHPQVQSWLQQMQAREAALTAVRQFLADALAARTKSAP